MPPLDVRWLLMAPALTLSCSHYAGAQLPHRGQAGSGGESSAMGQVATQP